MTQPGFDGFEKRLEIEFVHESTARTYESNLQRGLRALDREDIDSFLKDAECTIVSQLSNEYLDSYVLSESSLFIYPLQIVIKTCGTTKLLHAIPAILRCASRLQLKVKGCRYSRGTFNFPSAQPYPHTSFADEAAYLEKHFGNLGAGGQFCVMGDDPAGAHSWHVYHAAAEEGKENDMALHCDSSCWESDHEEHPVYTLEMCMTQLDREAAWHFCKSAHESAAEMTDASGIAHILPGSTICDFAFDPCGYSMNGIEDGAYSTIHITPEPGFSYASVEVMGYRPTSSTDLKEVVDRVVNNFKPGKFSMALSVASSGASAGAINRWAASDCIACPDGYHCDVSSTTRFGCDSSVVDFRTFKRVQWDTDESAHIVLETCLPVPLCIKSF